MQRAPTNAHRTWAQPTRLDSLRTGAATAEAKSRVREQSAAMERFLCEVCGDVIGAYEPLVMLTTESKRTTSRAAEPGLRARDGAYFHRECHDATAG
ncbi:MAG TPA: hypothetical protein VGL79_07885 [Solirubrobacteraceae bacterium]